MKGIPWWFHVLLAIVCYNGLKYGLPALSKTVVAVQPFLELLPTAAPLSAIVFLLIAAKELYEPGQQNQQDSEHIEPTDQDS